MPRKVFVAGEILTAADVNTNLMDQSVMVFADSTARSSAIPSPSEGMVTYREDANRVEVFDGSAFAPIGGILQVVSTTKTDTFSSNSTSMAAVTGLSASITPSSTSANVLVFVSVPGSFDDGGNANRSASFTIFKDGSDLLSPDTPGSRLPSFGGFSQEGTTYVGVASFSILDSPATTSEITYEVRGSATASTATFFVNRSTDDNDDGGQRRGVATITLMEVAV